MDDSMSISVSISKELGMEEFSRAVMDDAASRNDDVISNEQIRKSDMILQTYQVMSDPIFGGMGSVWKVFHQNWKTDLAMKRPQPRFFEEGSAKKKEEFIRECEYWIELGLHPNIVSCYYVREVGGVPTIFSEWMDGGSLKDRIKDGTLYEGSEEDVQKRILDIAIQTARGLQYSHEKGLIHQDIKPANLLLTKTWEAKVADFGLSKAAGLLRGDRDSSADADASQTDETVPRVTGYTPEYCPKEQAEGQEPKAWMDTYSWALTVLEMYAGKRLWKTGAEGKEHMQEYFGSCRFSVPQFMQKILLQCMQNETDPKKNVSSDIVEKLQEGYQILTRESYEREAPESNLYDADNLNNYALSMIDMGKQELAPALWERALEHQKGHIPSNINLLFYKWHQGKINDVELLDRLNYLPDCKEKTEARRIIEECRPSFETTLSLDNLHAEDYLCSCFDAEQTIWIGTKEALRRYDCSTGKELESFPVSAYAVYTEKTGKYVYFLSSKNENFIKYYGAVWRIDRTRGNAIEQIKLKDDENRIQSARDAATKDKDYCVYGDNRENRLIDLWLEDNENVLCVLMEKKMMTQFDVVFEIYVIHRYHLDKTPNATMKEDPVYEKIPSRCLLEAQSSRNDRWGITCELNMYLGVQNSGSEIGRTGVKSLPSPYYKLQNKDPQGWLIGIKFPVYAISPDAPLVLMKGKTSYEIRQIQGKPSRFQYILSRFAEVQTVAEREAMAEQIYKRFTSAVKKSDYTQAISEFELYRKVSGAKNSEKAYEMEYTLSRVCKRTNVHHYTFTDKKDFVADEPMYIRDRIEPRTLTPGWFPKDLFKAYKAVVSPKWRKATTFTYKDSHGRTMKLDAFGTLFLYRKDAAQAFIRAKRAVLRLDKKGHKLTPVALLPEEENYDETLVAAPDGITWIYSNKGTTMLFDGNTEGRPVDFTERMFTPDGRFVCGERIVPVSGQEKGVMLPEEFQKAESNDIRFSRDGFYICISTPSGASVYIRLSYEYSFPGFTDWDERAAPYVDFFKSTHNRVWTTQELDDLLGELKDRGLGYIRESGVRRKLSEK